MGARGARIRGASPALRAALALALVFLAFVVAGNPVELRVAAPPPPVLSGSNATPPSPVGYPIRHVVTVIMENHAYDDYFGVYCGTLGAYCAFVGKGLNLSRCLPLSPGNASAGCSRPFLYSGRNVTAAPNLNHDFPASMVAYDRGRMDGFFPAERNLETFGYYDAAQLPTYWDLAERYALGERFFSATLSYSLPNHWYLLAGQAPPISETWENASHANGRLTAAARAYLDQSNATSTIEEALARVPSVSWRYYDWGLPSYGRAIAGAAAPGSATPTAFDYWNPLAARFTSYANWTQHFVARSQFFRDAAAGTLANVSWVVPGFNESDHSPANIDTGMSFVTAVTRAVMTSPDWTSTALFVIWDDYGGHYDQVAPPQMYRYGLSFRVPLLVISPYTPQGYLDPNLGDLQSTLRFVEWRFGLRPVARTDAIAPLPLEYFDVRAAPRPPDPLPFPTAYPVPWQSLPPPGPPTHLLATQVSPTEVRLAWTPPLGGQPFAGYTLAWGPTYAAGQYREVLPRTWTSAVVPGLSSGVDYVFSLSAFAANVGSAGAVAALFVGSTGTPAVGPFPWSARFDL